MEAHLDYRSKNVIVLLFLIVSLSATLVHPVTAQKVKLALYYEALCDASAIFLNFHLSKIFDNGLIDIVDLKLSPYGNAKLGSNGTILCQHGEWECRLNTVEACAINAWPVGDHFRFIYCVESLSLHDKYSEWETCFQKLKLDPKDVTGCVTSGLGHKLELQYADEISALKPPHEYVPWVVVDGQPLKENTRYFMRYVCNAYKGSKVPQACHELSLPNRSAKPFNHVCYKEDNNAKSKSKVLKSL
ncbi:putative gamma interferon inducible lysosomal thiol reductase GILT [Helianthus annuus]|uniref:Gamma interferon inducible lysosomal thiol reductase GILT n=1 Tax=Helianthus annuus TaxID=4232 RepID=A0A251VNW9_HELAN|nr:gamma-interferon-responsive lysosomal thiol protein [Helianthus annuus]KAF5821679.1 putative gamma interferon inducible lysosomal thiol reductase GILT [Helianthus annuus]KAJ0611323.1 putative gamma interferon inducible lysosomal thiol reductase GILT [Helianthus annuus]KAJ0622322.1 putative gamma interferon inducible lysosomal thiol reductase GILT [Helianthus annuus]KAJ0626597.1 putative gamma interferon inducible lysosomal thiol reductase GILT [Helianthus annuus]KAJ0782941.1 putative gamma 